MAGYFTHLMDVGNPHPILRSSDSYKITTRFFEPEIPLSRMDTSIQTIPSWDSHALYAAVLKC